MSKLTLEQLAYINAAVAYVSVNHNSASSKANAISLELQKRFMADQFANVYCFDSIREGKRFRNVGFIFFDSLGIEVEICEVEATTSGQPVGPNGGPGTPGTPTTVHFTNTIAKAA